MNISIIIPNFNGAKLLSDNLPKIFHAINDYHDGTTEVIVVDDHSSDSSMEILEDMEKNNPLVVLRNEKNYGFSTTVNRGVRQATGDIVVLLNSDVVPEEKFLLKVVPHFTDASVFAVGFMDRSVEGDQIVLRGRGVIRWHRGFVLHRWGETTKKNTLWVSGGSGAFRRSLWNTLSGLNELYNPFYWEDIDLSYRALKAGYQLHFDNTITAIHEHDKGAIKSQHSQRKINMYAYRNQFLFFWLNISDLGLWGRHLLWLPFHIVNAIRDRNTVFFAGFLAACSSIPAVIQYRVSNRRKQVVSDRTILHQFRV